MQVFSVVGEAEFGPKKHVEKILGTIEHGDVTVACWEPGQISPYHCHPHATEIYFCFEGGGTMRTPDETVEVVPGAFVVHPPGEVHEYANGAAAHAAVPRALRRRHGVAPSANGAAAPAGRKARTTPTITGVIRCALNDYLALGRLGSRLQWFCGALFGTQGRHCRASIPGTVASYRSAQRSAAGPVTGRSCVDRGLPCASALDAAANAAASKSCGNNAHASCRLRDVRFHHQLTHPRHRDGSCCECRTPVPRRAGYRR